MPYDCIPYENLKKGQPILAFGNHVVAWDFESMGKPAYGFVPSEEKVCQWNFWWKTQRSSDPEWEDDCLLHLDTECEWDYPSGIGEHLDESGDIAEFFTYVDFSFCPNCGKKITYKE